MMFFDKNCYIISVVPVLEKICGSVGSYSVRTWEMATLQLKIYF